MGNQHDQSHRQEREQKKDEHSHPTRGKYYSSAHLTWTAAIGVILISAAVLVWTFLRP